MQEAVAIGPVAGVAAPRVVDAPTRRVVALWELVGFLVILFVGSFFHFAFELSGFATVMAPFGSVNESTWEHLKLFYWPGVAMAIIQHAYLRHRVNNFWLAKGVALIVISLGVSLSFYTYLGIVFPIEGKGSFLGTFATAVFGIGIGQYASYRLLVGRPRAAWTRTAGIGLIVALGVAFTVFTFAPPRIFLFENFAFYRYTGEYGILADYTPYLVFR